MSKLWMSIVCAAVLAGAAGARAADIATNDWKALFPGGTETRSVMGLPPGNRAFEVVNAAGETLGWVFRSDRVDPKVKGFKAELGVLTGLDTAGRIVGVKLVEHRDTPSYIAKLKESFYARFRGRAAAEPFDDLDAVTGATFSSKGVISDVHLSARTLLACQSVKARLKPGPKAGER